MEEERLPSKFTFILHADIASSTALVQQDEDVAHKRIQDTFRRFGDIITQYQGQVRELRGDASLAEFELLVRCPELVYSFEKVGVPFFRRKLKHSKRLNNTQPVSSSGTL